MSDLKMDSDMAAAMEEALKGPMSTDETERGLGSPGPNGDDVLDEDGKSPLPDGLPTSLIVNVDKIKEVDELFYFLQRKQYQCYLDFLEA